MFYAQLRARADGGAHTEDNLAVLCTAHHRHVHAHPCELRRGLDGAIRIDLPAAPAVPEFDSPISADMADAVRELAQLPQVDATIVAFFCSMSMRDGNRWLSERERSGGAIQCGDGWWRLRMPGGASDSRAA